MKKNFKEFKEFINNKNTAVLGIGISNIPLIRYLVTLGAKVSAFDKKNEEELGEVAQEFKAIGVTLVLGPDYMEKLHGFQVIFKTPSMRIDIPALVKEKEAGAIITSEMEEFVKYCPAKIFGVTGSDGKTTTTTLIYKMLLQEGFKTWVGGNIGTPLFTQIEEIKPDDMVVIELSSFQLMTMRVSPEVAVVTNLSPNHLDMHNGMEEYIDSKKNIFKFQGKEDTIILNRDNIITNSMASEIKSNLLNFSVLDEIKLGAYYKERKLYINNKEVCTKDEVKIKGMHNVENLLAAFCAVNKDVSISSMRAVAITFSGVEHRCEFVREVDEINFYNDSIGTSPTRTLASMNAFEQPVILMAGGYDKNIPFEVLAEQGYSKIKILILMGATKFKIKAVFDELAKRSGKVVPIVIVESLEDAVIKARELAVSGDIVILSPACASFDAYPNFEVKGNRYKEIVNSL
ncbi:MAG: UDP-N-acetylmuramoyl-L-alanine--D-glutamate ligase [Clostridiaceae bacterium]|nr:UDP-N-acetylmuramoyl-L-alanine--D-glutamate ligase [Clostridiaceae bacterium]